MRQDINDLKVEVASLQDRSPCKGGGIVEVKEAMKEEITKAIVEAIKIKTKAMADSIEIKMDAKEGWLEVVHKNLRKEAKKEAQKGEHLIIQTAIEKEKTRQARCLNVQVIGIIETTTSYPEEDAKDIQHWCRSCHNCQVNGNKRLLYGPRQAVIANGSFEKWGIDAMGPLPRTANGKLYIFVAIDYMTRFGTPIEIVSDNGPGFRRGLLTEVCEELKISHRHSTPYYPQSNGLVEKANGIIAGIIRKMVESKPKR
ncbi:hypothetical protein L7F22_057655 [Adiantum nelumboides]|nr:hypothetical protein [Adiantum nelumboides]